MKKVTYAFGETPKQEEKGIEFTHCLDVDCGWRIPYGSKYVFLDVSYLGKCRFDGDMFAVKFSNGAISIYKGHLNNGTWK